MFQIVQMSIHWSKNANEADTLCERGNWKCAEILSSQKFRFRFPNFRPHLGNQVANRSMVSIFDAFCNKPRHHFASVLWRVWWESNASVVKFWSEQWTRYGLCCGLVRRSCFPVALRIVVHRRRHDTLAHCGSELNLARNRHSGRWVNHVVQKMLRKQLFHTQVCSKGQMVLFDRELETDWESYDGRLGFWLVTRLFYQAFCNLWIGCLLHVFEVVKRFRKRTSIGRVLLKHLQWSHWVRAEIGTWASLLTASKIGQSQCDGENRIQ